MNDPDEKPSLEERLEAIMMLLADLERRMVQLEVIAQDVGATFRVMHG
jgi:hypothetical protein